MKQALKTIVIFAFSLFALAFFVPKSEMRARQIETAGQHFKNIKVLTDMPADQMGKVMNIMAASLGVNCNFCHVEGDFSKDDKEEKQAARQMIKMTFDLNKSYFKGRPEIACNTCHQGYEHPQSAINLSAARGKEEIPKQPEAKLSVEQILQKYAQAVGKENAAKINSRMITAARVEPNGKIETEEIYQKGEKILITTEYPQTLVTEAFDGGAAWKRGGDKTINLKPDEAEQIKRGAQFFAFTDLKTVYPKIDFRAVDKIDGREVYLVTAQTADNTRERLYFDAQTGFLVRRVSSVPTVLGSYQYQVDYADYKNFSGVKLPTTVRYAVPNISFTRKILKVKNNAVIDDAKFNQPAK